MVATISIDQSIGHSTMIAHNMAADGNRALLSKTVRGLLDMIFASEGERSHGKADVVREVA